MTEEVPTYHAGQVSLGPGAGKVAKAAQAGDYAALGKVFGIAAACARKGKTVPEPYAAIVARALNDLDLALRVGRKQSAKRLRDVVFTAVVGKAKRGPKGRRVRASAATLAAEVAILRLHGRTRAKAEQEVSERFNASAADVKAAVDADPAKKP